MKPTKISRRIAIFNAEGAVFATTHGWDEDAGKWVRASSDSDHKRLCKAMHDLRRTLGHSAMDGAHPGLAHTA